MEEKPFDEDTGLVILPTNRPTGRLPANGSPRHRRSHSPQLKRDLEGRSLPPFGCGSKERCQNGTLVRGNMDQNPRNPSCLILSHSHLTQVIKVVNKWSPALKSSHSKSKFWGYESGSLPTAVYLKTTFSHILWMDEILHHFETTGWFLQGNHDSRVSQVVQDFVHPQYLWE